MLKLTRLNHRVVAVNPDHISWVEETPDTTLSLFNGEKLLVRETLDELMEEVVRYRRKVRMVEPEGAPLGPREGDPPRVSWLPGGLRGGR
ncbi:MAG: flagellar FlbD family protein [Deltaproteobacteria bacterium]|nr:flagellar FlbD family protein [Deltaproteobacteria bacterium]